MSFASVAGSHSMCFICSEISLILLSNLPEYGFEWWTHSCTTMSWHVQSNIVIIKWSSHLLGKSDGRHFWGAVHSSPSMMVWNLLDTPLLVSWALIHTVLGIPYNIVPPKGLSSHHQCKGGECCVGMQNAGSLARVQLRFSLCCFSNNNKALVPVYILFIGLLVQAQLKQSYASCLAS